MYSGVARSSYRQHCWSGRGHLSHEVRMGTPQRERSGIGRGTCQSANQLTDWRRRRRRRRRRKRSDYFSQNCPFLTVKKNRQYNGKKYSLCKRYGSYGDSSYPHETKNLIITSEFISSVFRSSRKCSLCQYCIGQMF